VNALDIVAAAKAFVVAAGGPQLDANVGHVPQPTLADVAETHSLRAVRRGFQSALPPVVASAKPTKTPSAPKSARYSYCGRRQRGIGAEGASSCRSERSGALRL